MNTNQSASKSPNPTTSSFDNRELFFSPELKSRLQARTRFEFTPCVVPESGNSSTLNPSWKPVNRPKSATYNVTKSAPRQPIQRQRQSAKAVSQHRRQPAVVQQATEYVRGPRNRVYFEKLSSRLKSKFGELLLLIAEEEQRIELQRQQLAMIDVFEPYSCFTRIDRNNSGTVSSREIV
jgi:hypothetical protein